MVYYTEHPPGRTLNLNTQEYLYFGGTSYLGVQADPEFRELLIENIRKYGGGHGASRMSNLRLKIYEQAEQQLAAWTGSESALTTSSGFLAGQLLSYFFDRGPYQLFYAPNAHEAMIRGKHTPFEDYDSLGAALTKSLSRKKSHGTPVLFTDSIDLCGSAYPHFETLKKLPLQEMILVADDSHGLGILGENGGGTYRSLARLGAKELLVCASLGKAPGIQGGVILGLEKRLAELWETPFFAGASPAPPGHLATLLEAASLYDSKRIRLAQNIRFFEKECLQKNGFASLAGYPVYAYKNNALTSFLDTEKILVTDFPYPSSVANALTGRIVLSSHHLEEDIRRLCYALNAYYNAIQG
jgi:7-keto-8-aminopelargonate synthetase-like enzyme